MECSPERSISPWCTQSVCSPRRRLTALHPCDPQRPNQRTCRLPSRGPPPPVAPHPTLAEQLSMRRGSLRRETNGEEQETAGKRESMLAPVQVATDLSTDGADAGTTDGTRTSAGSVGGIDDQAAAYPLPVAAEMDPAEGVVVAEREPTGEGVVVATRQGTLVYH